MPNTLAAFNSLGVSSRARPSQINTNFGALRGTRIPIDETAAASANHLFDLGSEDHRWRDAYFNRPYISGITSVSDFSIYQNALFVGSTEIAKYDSISCLNQYNFVTFNYYSVYSSSSQFFSSLASDGIFLTLTCHGRPVRIFAGCLENYSGTGYGYSSHFFFIPRTGQTYTFDILRNGTTISSINLYIPGANSMSLPNGFFDYTDYSAPAGVNTYKITGTFGWNKGSSYNIVWTAMELG